MRTASVAPPPLSRREDNATRLDRGANGLDSTPDSLPVWVDRYEALVVEGVRSPQVAAKIDLHLDRFRAFFVDVYGHERISTVGRLDVVDWQRGLAEKLAPATVNNHVASLVGFTTWVSAQASDLFATGNPSTDVGVLPLPPLEPRSLTEAQVRSLKNLCDRLERYSQRKGRRRGRGAPPKRHGHSRPIRDRAIVFLLLSTGLRRQELVLLDVDQVQPSQPALLRSARRARIVGVRGKGKTQRTVFLSIDARRALADYLKVERPVDADSTALFLSAVSVSSRRPDGRFSGRSVNTILERIGRLHDAEHTDPERHISPLRPHDLRHTFAFQLAQATNADPYELERRLGHRSQRYIARYTNPPEHIAASYVEQM